MKRKRAPLVDEVVQRLLGEESILQQSDLDFKAKLSAKLVEVIRRAVANEARRTGQMYLMTDPVIADDLTVAHRIACGIACRLAFLRKHPDQVGKW